MYQTTYHKGQSLDQVRKLHAELPEPSYISGGFTLIPAMKNRLAAPENLIDLRALPELRGITRDGDRLRIGAASCHAEVAGSPEVAQSIPALALLADSIGDMQVRHMGTIGGSVANNDPAADYPAAVLALGATIITDQREIAAHDFFTGMYATDLAEGEIILRIDFPVPRSAGYAKLRNPASKYAIAASFVARGSDGSVRVAVTGAGEDGVFRWFDAEQALADRFETASVEALQPDPGMMLSDLHGSAEYRAALVKVMTARAVDAQGSVDIC
ncbi:FAD binding domain-containing protein [Alkalilacustris brevis]|uniref:FAD binding domain-containing protein n=1 Tax=Alkalilacustris brevis TaxID=2026338 RepID=UPI000E0D34EC|nr:xanthine dehydrogenase family protein subunit M [Alkalilacustris brevis]